MGNPKNEILCENLLKNLHNLKLDERIEDAKETSGFRRQIPAEAEYLYVLLDSCLKGEYHHVKKFLQETKNPELLLTWVDKNGNTALICVASRELPRMVELLLEFGADINAQNDHGRTALMEAVLWGQWASVNYILDKGAAWLEDNDGNSAVDLSKINERNERERWERLQNENIQRPYVSNYYRQQIADLLEPEETLESLLDPTLSGASCHHFDNAILSSCPVDRNILRLTAPVREFLLPRSTKAMACIKLDGHPTQYTMSGNTHTTLGVGVITNKNWTIEVMRIASHIGHDFGSDPRGWACHAELQAIAGYIHWYLPQFGVPWDRITEYCFFLHPHQIRPRMVLILVSQEMCSVCQPFVKAINDITSQRFGFAFDVRDGSPNGRYSGLMRKLALSNIIGTSSHYV
ncbi:ankyrin repeat [Pyrenophora seminiperda CCB06]|uniref:Ankyrin repeat n=1 Tax=Pyrenophora seminiperda CCB06 TaxID=1302712 RepID=A0A3M7LVU4_9PLEO|nr:ankyrin repeat [Pyrenophora seminiperda CCB06]